MAGIPEVSGLGVEVVVTLPLLYDMTSVYMYGCTPVT